ncbi:MAG: MFS transporter [Planctomycetaceae bacterium]|nr:MFS transporter [Planctomycetaceae bacterium]
MAPSGKAGLFLIFVTVFIDLLGFGIVLPLLPRYGESFEAGKWELGLLMASFSAMQFLFAPVWGRISDRVGRRPILILGLAGSTVSYGLFGYATSLGVDGSMLGLSALVWLFITRIGAGIAGATIPTAQAYIADVTGPEERAKGMALIGAAFGIGFTFGPLLGAFFVSDIQGAAPSSAPGYVASVLSGCALLFAIAKLPESLNPDSKPAKRHWLDVGSFRTAIAHPHVGMILATIFITTFAFGQFESTLALLTKELRMSQQENFYVFAYIGLILTLSQGFLVRRLAPKVGDYKMSLAGVSLMVAGLLAVGWVALDGTTNKLYTLVPLCVVGYAATTPSLQSMLSLSSLDSEQGGILGLGQSISALARILGPVAGVVLFNEGKTPANPYWFGAGLMGVGLLAVLLLKNAGFRPDTKASEEPAPNAGQEA